MMPRPQTVVGRLPQNAAGLDAFLPIEDEFLARARPGDPVLLLVKYYDPSHEGCNPEQASYRFVCWVYFGILSDASPLFERRGDDLLQEFRIMFRRHFSWHGGKSHQVSEGAVSVTLPEIKFEDPEKLLYSPVLAEAHEQRRREVKTERFPDFPVEFLLGHEEIQRYLGFRTRELIDFYLRALKALGLQGVELTVPIQAYIKARRREISGLLLALSRGEEGGAKMRPLIEEALLLDMRQMPWVRELEPPGLTLDVPVFVKAMAKRIGVSLS